MGGFLIELLGSFLQGLYQYLTERHSNIGKCQIILLCLGLFIIGLGLITVFCKPE